MANRLPDETRKLVLRLLCEGSSIRSASRVTGVEKKTVGRLILGFGEASKSFLDDTMRGLTLAHVECDEIWSYVAKKQARLTVEEKEFRGDIGDVYLFTALDKETKLVPTFALGKRTADNCRRFMVDLAGRLVMPPPGAGDAHAFEAARHTYITQISTDGFPGYPEAVDLAFGGRAKYGTIIKQYRNAGMQYDPSEMVGTERRVIRGSINPWSICTSHVERHNGTIRSFMRRFTRLTNAFSKKLENHAAACAMFLAYYNFVWRTRYPDQSGKRGRSRPTAAMMAKVVPNLWDFDRLYDEVIRYG